MAFGLYTRQVSKERFMLCATTTQYLATPRRHHLFLLLHLHHHQCPPLHFLGHGPYLLLLRLTNPLQKNKAFIPCAISTLDILAIRHFKCPPNHSLESQSFFRNLLSASSIPTVLDALLRLITAFPTGLASLSSHGLCLSSNQLSASLQAFLIRLFPFCECRLLWNLICCRHMQFY